MESRDRHDDELLWQFLEADPATLERIRDNALRPVPVKPSRYRRLGMVLCLSLLAFAVVYVMRTPQRAPDNMLTIESSDDLMLVKAADGRTWVLGAGPMTETTPGGMEMVVVVKGGR